MKSEIIHHLKVNESGAARNLIIKFNKILMAYSMLLHLFCSTNATVKQSKNKI